MAQSSINIFHLGVGKVGTTFLKQLIENKSRLEELYKLKINFIAIFRSSGGIFNASGIPNIEKIIGSKNDREFFSDDNQPIPRLLKTSPLPLIVLDTTSSDKMTEFLLLALKLGAFVVMSNKKPLSSSYQDYAQLQKFQHRLFFETTVGAGLPIISTLKGLLNTYDEIMEISGCFSGTLGFIFSELEKGFRFSDIVKKAKKLGFTEPDPRDDLSGTDVARKALILDRLIGKNLNLEDIKIQSLYPARFKKMAIEDFLVNLNTLDVKYKEMMNKAKKQNATLRFVASITKSNLTVGLKQVPKDSDIGNLNGPDNIVVIRTKRYNSNPLVIKGPGAGIEVTAAGVLDDIIKIIRIIRGNTL